MEREKRNEILVVGSPPIPGGLPYDDRRAIENAHRVLRYEALRELAAEVAVELGKLGYPTSVAPAKSADVFDIWHPDVDVMLADPDFAGVALVLAASPHEPKRLAIGVRLVAPELVRHGSATSAERPSITVAIARPEAAIAREIERRVLPAARTYLREVRERAHAYAKASSGATEAAETLLATGYFRKASSHDGDRTSESLYFPGDTERALGLDVYGPVEVRAGKVSLSRVSLSPDDLVAVLGLLAERRKAAA